MRLLHNSGKIAADEVAPAVGEILLVAEELRARLVAETAGWKGD